MRKVDHRVNSKTLETSTDALNFFIQFLENAHLGRMDRVKIKVSVSVRENFFTDVIIWR